MERKERNVLMNSENSWDISNILFMDNKVELRVNGLGRVYGRERWESVTEMHFMRFTEHVISNNRL